MQFNYILNKPLRENSIENLFQFLAGCLIVTPATVCRTENQANDSVK